MAHGTPWNEVDWSMEDSDIAEFYGIRPDTVRKKRNETFPSKERLSRNISIRLPEKLYNAVEYQADLLNIKIVDLVRWALFQHLDAYELTYQYEQDALNDYLKESYYKKLPEFKDYSAYFRRKKEQRNDDPAWAMKEDEARLSKIHKDRESRKLGKKKDRQLHDETAGTKKLNNMWKEKD